MGCNVQNKESPIIYSTEHREYRIVDKSMKKRKRGLLLAWLVNAFACESQIARVLFSFVSYTLRRCRFVPVSLSCFMSFSFRLTFDPKFVEQHDCKLKISICVSLFHCSQYMEYRVQSMVYGVCNMRWSQKVHSVQAT